MSTAAGGTQHDNCSGAKDGTSGADVLPRWQDLAAPAWHATKISDTYRAWLSAWDLPHTSSLLEAALQVLLAVSAAGGWAAAEKLYGADVSNCLEQLRAFVTPGVAAVVAALYR